MEDQPKTPLSGDEIIDTNKETLEKRNDVFDKFEDAIKEICPTAKKDYDSFSGLTFFVTPFESPQDKQRIIDGVIEKIKEKYPVDSEWRIKTGKMDWTLLATDEKDYYGREGYGTLTWSCQERFETLRK